MGISKMSILTFLFLLTLVSFGISYFQFREKGFLLNNAWLYASAEERNEMDKKPYYRQSGIVFFLVGIIFLLNFVEVISGISQLFYAVLILCVITVIYATASSIKIETTRK